MKKRITAILTAAVMALSMTVCSYADNTVVKFSDVKVKIDDEVLDVPAGHIWVSEDGYTMIAARTLVEGAGGKITWDSATRTAEIKGLSRTAGTYTKVAAYEHLVLAASYQMSAECHALMMQAFNIAKRNVDEMRAKAEAGTDGYAMKDGELLKDGKRVAVISDVDDTLVDGVHYTANIVGKAGDWNNAAFTRFIMSDGCTALPGAVDFVKHCVDNGIEFFYLTNRYDQAYKVAQKDSKGEYTGKDGYKAADGTLIGDSVYDVFGKTVYDISWDSLEKLGFPLGEDAHLIVNDLKLRGSSKEPVRRTVARGGRQFTGEREESSKHPLEFLTSAHHIAMLVGDDLNDISDIFKGDAIERVELAIEHMDKWGAEWIVLPNGVYGSAYNAAMSYGISELFDYFDYTNKDSKAWEIYK